MFCVLTTKNQDLNFTFKFQNVRTFKEDSHKPSNIRGAKLHKFTHCPHIHNLAKIQ